MVQRGCGDEPELTAQPVLSAGLAEDAAEAVDQAADHVRERRRSKKPASGAARKSAGAQRQRRGQPCLRFLNSESPVR